jgi:16S rRNA (cytidine1402-2'-O)-methyltransferase
VTATDTTEADNRLIALRQAVTRELDSLIARPLTRGLYLVATPIGHLGDMTLRALTTLASVDRIYCEDTRHSQRLFDHYGLSRPASPYHEHNGEIVRPQILKDLSRGARLALISDAGTPLISDPGYKLVRAAIEAGHPVTALPGPSAVLAGLAVAGLPTDSFHFAGFLPPKPGQRQNRLAALSAIEATVVVFEAPTRVVATLADVAAAMPDRMVAVARELTKLHETVLRGTAAAVAAEIGTTEVKGECVLLIAPAVGRAVVTDADITARLVQALAVEPLSAAVRTVADALGTPKKHVYDLALALKSGRTP